MLTAHCQLHCESFSITGSLLCEYCGVLWFLEVTEYISGNVFFFFNDTPEQKKMSYLLHLQGSVTVQRFPSAAWKGGGVTVVVQRLLRVVNTPHRGRRDVSLSIPVENDSFRIVKKHFSPACLRGLAARLIGSAPRWQRQQRRRPPT